MCIRDSDGAEEACRLALDLVGEAPGADDCTVRSLLNDLAWAHQRAGDLEGAERSFRDALSIHEQYRDMAAALAAPSGVGPGAQQSPYRAPSPKENATSGGLDRAVAHSLVGLGWTLFELGRVADADAAFGRALMLASLSGGPEDTSLRAEALRGQGTVAFELGRYADADRCYRRAADAPLACDTPQSIALLLDRAWLACTCGEDPRAEGLLVEAERRLRNSPSHVSLVGALHAVWAELRRRQGNDKEAHKHSQRAVVLAEEALAEHPRRASVLALAARVHVSRSELTAAERYGRRALELLRGSGLPQTHARFAEVSIAMGELHAARGHWGAAEEAFRTALEVRESRLGPEHPELDEILEGLTGVYEATGRTAEQADLQQRRDALLHAQPEELAS